MVPSAASSPPIADLVRFLFARREVILSNLRAVCERDPDLHNIGLLSREEFNDLLPALLNNLEQSLLEQPPGADGTASLPVRSDPGKVYRIAQNLLLNALNYTPSGVGGVVTR